MTSDEPGGAKPASGRGGAQGDGDPAEGVLPGSVGTHAPPAVKVTCHADMTVVDLFGEIDIATSDALAGAVTDALAAQAPVVVDLSAVTFLDSVGVSFLVKLATLARERGRGVALRGVPSTVREVLTLVGVWELFVTSG